jgi:hypothetical protein
MVFEHVIMDLVSLSKNFNLTNFEIWQNSPCSGIYTARTNGVIEGSGGALPLYILYTCAFGTYLLGGYLPCIENYKVWFFQNKGKCLYFNTPYQ